jgi:hypothetical protein
MALLWTRTESFFRDYRGKRVVVGHTHTMELPAELSTYTVDDPTDVWAGPCVTAIDTGCGRDGFLTALELPVDEGLRVALKAAPRPHPRTHPVASPPPHAG